MKPILFLLLLTTSYLQAQTDSDSTALVQGSWEIQNLPKGIIWKKIHFQNNELFKANQSINILELPRKSRQFSWALVTADSLKKTDKTKGQLRPTSKIAQENGAIVGVNGGFFDVKNGGSVDFFKSRGYITDTTRALKGSTAAFHGKAAVVIAHKKLKILKGQPQVGWEYHLPYKDVMLSGPLLLLNGQPEILAKNAFNDNRHPRTCVCITHHNKVLLITVDGRSSQSFGMNLPELTFLAQQLGCRDALNLDGGGSTTMWVANQGVVNYPSDNKKFDHEGERAVSNVLLAIPR